MPLVPTRKGQLLLHRALVGPLHRAFSALATAFPLVGFFALRKQAPSEVPEEPPVVQLTLTNGEKRQLKLAGGSTEEACYAAAQLGTALGL
jgi:hypothetical protein